MSLLKHTSFPKIIIKHRSPQLLLEMFEQGTMSNLMDFINKVSENYKELGYEIIGNPEDSKNKLKGDLFEIFIENFLIQNGSSNTIGISNYVPNNPDEDYGIDGFCINHLGEISTVQIKYRSNISSFLENSEISGFGFTSYAYGHINNNSKAKRLYIVTTAKDITPSARKCANDKFQIINFDFLSAQLDNYPQLWSNMRDRVETTYNALINKN